MPDFRAKMHQKSISVGWGSAPDPAVGAYSAPPDPLAGFEGPTSKGRGGRGKGRTTDIPNFLGPGQRG